ncbi:MAG: aspartate aminotransferase family protein [Thermoanaerobaculia bacterium]|nr:aspartate aminotransferase family protein [Thermoanaerobaculia bacterium]
MSLEQGDLPPLVTVPPPGPRSRALCTHLARVEAPGVNTLYRGHDQIVWAEALGSNVLDVDSNRYLDFTSGFGVAFVGHRHPAVVAAVADQAGRLVHGLGDVAAHPSRIALADRLCQLAPVDDPVVYFAISGSDAIEVALKTALLATGRSVLLAFEPAYHGLTLGALAAGSRREFQAPFEAHLHGHVRRLPFGASPSALRSALAPGDVAAVVVEPIVGREGVLLPPAGWLAELAALARSTETLVVADEIFTGFGKTGRRFVVEAEGIRPDLLVCGKALGGGLPIGAVVGTRVAMSAWASDGEARHTATFLAHPLACAAALATLDVIENEELVERARELGAHLAARTASWHQRFSRTIHGTRGRGLLQAVEFAELATASRFATRALDRGVILLAGGPEGRTVQLVPPAVISRERLDDALGRLESVLGEQEP